jgi:hypothetical protein
MSKILPALRDKSTLHVWTVLKQVSKDRGIWQGNARHAFPIIAIKIFVQQLQKQLLMTFVFPKVCYILIFPKVLFCNFHQQLFDQDKSWNMTGKYLEKGEDN